MNILEEANELTGGDRQQDYGHPLDNYQRLADMMTGYLGARLNGDLTAQDAGMFMVLCKVAREATKHKRDNLVDGAGYFRVIEMMRDEVKRRAD
ncbi:MAG: hypothetical protein CMN85_10725 [Spongiibacteraceae bacterium]|nr:hypothetical protein [Spongiibacteraceae bacterium]|tara:strand:+ start:34558 stop:34839 length:282 start_codon:yes stop_codon:yes gene_type:complete